MDHIMAGDLVRSRTRIALEKQRRDNEEALNFDPGGTGDPRRISNEEPTQGGLC